MLELLGLAAANVPMAVAVVRAAVSDLMPVGDAPNAILSEVDLLRAQVRHLRSEIFAMADKPQVETEPAAKPKRYRGQSDLPRPLRRHLRETRGVRTA